MANDNTQIVFGNYGQLTVDRTTGSVVKRTPPEACVENGVVVQDDGHEYADIERVEIPAKLDGGENTDICFCGLWFKVDGVLTYEPPCWKPDVDDDGNVVDYTEAEREALEAERGIKS